MMWTALIFGKLTWSVFPQSLIAWGGAIFMIILRPRSTCNHYLLQILEASLERMAYVR